MTNLTHLDRLTGGITPDVGRTLHDLARKVPTGQAIVEIGSYLGKSVSYLATGARENVPVYAVDPWETVQASGWFRRNRMPEPTLVGFTDQLAGVGLAGRVTPLQGLSVEIAKTYSGPLIGLLYIDGDHSAGAADADFNAWQVHLAPQATVAIDDYGLTRNPEVAKSVRRIEKFFSGPVTVMNKGRIAVASMP